MEQPASTTPSTTRTAPDPAAYWAAVQAEDDRLHGTLAAIRADQDSGYLTVYEAADNRVNAMSAHLAACAAHRLTFLECQPEADPDGPSLNDEVAAAVSDALHAEAAEAYPDPDSEQLRPLAQPQHSAEWVREAFPAWTVVLRDGQTWEAQRSSGTGPVLRAPTLGLLVETISDQLERERAAEALADGAPPIPEERLATIAQLLPPVAVPGDARRFWG